MVITVDNIMVKVEGLSKEFRGEMILQDVNITLERGKIYGLVGMNGSGKMAKKSGRRLTFHKIWA